MSVLPRLYDDLPFGRSLHAFGRSCPGSHCHHLPPAASRAAVALGPGDAFAISRAAPANTENVELHQVLGSNNRSRRLALSGRHADPCAGSRLDAGWVVADT